MTTLEYDSWGRQPDFYWNNRDSYYRHCEDKQELTFSDGSSIPLRGKTPSAYWTASHGYGSGWGQCFEVGGDMLVVSPETIANACADDGYIGALCIAPPEWCAGGFPLDFRFIVVDCDNTFYAQQPRNLYECAVFLRQDLEIFLSGERDAAKAVKGPEKLRSQREQNLLRVIAGLWALSGLPLEHNVTADKLSALFDTWAWDGPAKSTMADTILKPAAALPKVKPRMPQS